jgi:hypothetical protein
MVVVGVGPRRGSPRSQRGRVGLKISCLIHLRTAMIDQISAGKKREKKGQVEEKQRRKS